MWIMRAVVCRQPGTLVLEDRPEPVRGEGEVLLAVRRMGICGTDYHIYEGKHPFLHYPRVMGHELAAEVLEGPEGGAFVRGQIVVVNPYIACGTCIACRNGKPNCCTRISVLGVHVDGGMCERISVPEGNLYAVGNLSVDAAACVEFLAIGAHAVARSKVQPGMRVLVVGAGPIGLGVALFARLSGGEVTVLDRDEQRLAIALEAGAAVAGLTADARTAERAAVATGGEGFNLVFDATGNRASMEGAVAFVAHGGALVLVSVVNEAISYSDPEFHRREMMIIGSRNALGDDFERVMAAMSAGQVPLDLLITDRTNLAASVRDLPRWATEKTGLVKALIEIV